MSAQGARPGRLRVHFDLRAWAEDLRHATVAGRRVAEQAREQLDRDGASREDLLACQAEGPDGTRLPRCVKLYLPDRAGQWRMVFEVTHDPTDGRLVLQHLAFGLGHPSRPWQPSAYQVAHLRLNSRPQP